MSSLANELEKLAEEEWGFVELHMLIKKNLTTIISALREREAEPVAWLYEREDHKSEVALFRWRDIVDGKWRFGAEGWTETPLVRAGKREAE